MDIQEITVTYEETASFPSGHSNVKAGVRFTARVGSDDDPGRVRASLEVAAVEAVRQQIDRALETNGFSARYADALFRVFSLTELALIAMVPEKVSPADFGFLRVPAEEVTTAPVSKVTASQIARRAAQGAGCGVFDCSNGRIDRLERMYQTEKGNQ